MSSTKKRAVAKPPSPPGVEAADFSIRAIVSLPLLDRKETISRNDNIGDALKSRVRFFKQELRSFGLSVSTVKQLFIPPRRELFPIPKNINDDFGGLLSLGTNQMALITSLSPRPGEDLITLLKAGSTSTTSLPSATASSTNQDFTLRTVATLHALDYENDFPDTESHEIIITMFDAIARRLRRVLDLPSSIQDAAGEFFECLEVYPNMVEEQLPEDGQTASLRQVFPAGTNKVLAIAPLKREYYDLLLEYLAKGNSYETFPESPASSDDELASEEVPPSSASSDSRATTPSEARNTPDNHIISRLLERITTIAHEQAVLQGENIDLQSEVKHLEDENANLRRSNADLESSVATLKNEKDVQLSENSRLRKLIQYMERENGKLKRDNTNLLNDKADVERDNEELRGEKALSEEHIAELESENAALVTKDKEMQKKLVTAQQDCDELLYRSRATSRRSLLDKVRNKLQSMHGLPDDYLHPDVELSPDVPSPEALSNKLRKNGSRTLSASAITMIFGSEPSTDGDTMRRQLNRAAHQFIKEDVTEAVLADDLDKQQRSLFCEIFVFYWGHVPKSLKNM